jgi:micrococcal nuclease
MCVVWGWILVFKREPTGHAVPNENATVLSSVDRVEARGLANHADTIGQLAPVGGPSTNSREDVRREHFVICTGSRSNCVIDGDTFIMDGTRVRIADIDAPEIGGAKCDSEYRLALRAKFRLVDLLNAGPVTLQQTGRRDADKYGRKLRVVIRDGRSIGNQLVQEGLARAWDGGKHPWC